MASISKDIGVLAKNANIVLFHKFTIFLHLYWLHYNLKGIGKDFTFFNFKVDWLHYGHIIDIFIQWPKTYLSKMIVLLLYLYDIYLF